MNTEEYKSLQFSWLYIYVTVALYIDEYVKLVMITKTPSLLANIDEI